ncbi:MAG: hypothetical protein M1818_004156 [Claussenomyces sp. TS43310]|nr:MAG: hypothetical protein M1818_004156 [Claussenomyces sp. TS43310]
MSSLQQEPDSRTSSVGRKRAPDPIVEQNIEYISIDSSSASEDDPDQRGRKRRKIANDDAPTHPSPAEDGGLSDQPQDISSPDNGLPFARSREESNVPVISWNQGVQTGLRTSFGSRVLATTELPSKPGSARGQGDKSSNGNEARLASPALMSSIPPVNAPDHIGTFTVGRQAYSLPDIYDGQGNLVDFQSVKFRKFIPAFLRANEPLLEMMTRPVISASYPAYLKFYHSNSSIGRKALKRKNQITEQDVDFGMQAARDAIRKKKDFPGNNMSEDEISGLEQAALGGPGFITLQSNGRNVQSLAGVLTTAAGQPSEERPRTHSIANGTLDVTCAESSGLNLLVSSSLPELEPLSAKNTSSSRDMSLGNVDNSAAPNPYNDMSGKGSPQTQQAQNIEPTDISNRIVSTAGTSTRALDTRPLGYDQALVGKVPQSSTDATPADIDKAELDLLLMYYPGISGIHCLLCLGMGHQAAACPSLTCASCGLRGHHFQDACPKTQRCSKCNELGHQKSDCRERLNAPRDDGMCDICRSMSHITDDCHLIWRSFRPDPYSLKKVNKIPVFCYCCGAEDHFGAECGLRRSYLLSGGITWSHANLDQYVDIRSEVRALSAGVDYTIASRPGRQLSIKGKARDEQMDLDESENEGSSFLRPPVPKRAAKGKIRFSQPQPPLPPGPPPPSGPASQTPGNLANRITRPTSDYRRRSRSPPARHAARASYQNTGGHVPHSLPTKPPTQPCGPASRGAAAESARGAQSAGRGRAPKAPRGHRPNRGKKTK